MNVLRRERKFLILYKEIYLILRISFFTSERLKTVLRGTTTFDLHLSENKKINILVDTYQTNFKFCFP
jgi:hypothetical protein